MAVTSRNLRTNSNRWQNRRMIRTPQPQAHRVARTVVVRERVIPQTNWLNFLMWAMIIIMLSLIIGTMSGWVGTVINDFRYGRPRVSHLTARVGHEGEQNFNTEFMAINLNRRVVVLEFPGGDASQARTIVGPYLFGAGEDLTPVTLDTLDVNADQRPDLLVNIKNEQLVYINQPDGFRMITPAEQGTLNQAQP